MKRETLKTIAMVLMAGLVIVRTSQVDRLRQFTIRAQDSAEVAIKNAQDAQELTRRATAAGNEAIRQRDAAIEAAGIDGPWKHWVTVTNNVAHYISPIK